MKANELEPDNIWGYKHHADFLITHKKDFRGAEEQLRLALDIVGDNIEEILWYKSRFLSLLFLNGKFEEAFNLNSELLKISQKTKKGKHHYKYLPEMLFYFFQFVYVMDNQAQLNALREIKNIQLELKNLNYESCTDLWLLREHVKKAKRNQHPHSNIIIPVKNVVLGELELERLDKFEIWKSL